MIATAHQPHFLPWLGYYNKLVNCDAFILLDDVQYRKLYFQNRTQIKNMHGARHMLTVPVHFSHDSLLLDVSIACSNWKLPLLRTIEFSYSRSSFFNECWDDLRSAIEDAGSSLLGLLLSTFDITIRHLGLEELAIYRSSWFATRREPTQRLVDLCREVGADIYLFGEGGSVAYHDLDVLEANGISTVTQDFSNHHPTYPQLHGPFVPGLSVIDCLFNVGQSGTLALLRNAWRISNT